MKELEPAAIEQQPPISVTGDELDQLVEGAEQLPKVEDSRIRQLRELKEKRLLSLARKYDPEVHLLKLNDVSFFETEAGQDACDCNDVGYLVGQRVLPHSSSSAAGKDRLHRYRAEGAGHGCHLS